MHYYLLVTPIKKISKERERGAMRRAANSHSLKPFPAARPVVASVEEGRDRHKMVTGTVKNIAVDIITSAVVAGCGTASLLRENVQVAIFALRREGAP